MHAEYYGPVKNINISLIDPRQCSTSVHLNALHRTYKKLMQHVQVVHETHYRTTTATVKCQLKAHFFTVAAFNATS